MRRTSELSDCSIGAAPSAARPAGSRPSFARGSTSSPVEGGAADADLRRVLREHPRLSAKEREEVARVTRERVGRAFDALTGVILAFKGI